MFVGLRAHHKHAQYLIQASEIFGLSADDRAVIANVARYHRRALPQKAHLPYMALDRQDRVRVNKLAALLRVANALDAEHVAEGPRRARTVRRRRLGADGRRRRRSRPWSASASRRGRTCSRTCSASR